MLSYRHGFHAGNFADVFKHAVLTLIITGLRRKDTPFCYLDMHAGAGCYDLRDGLSLKNREFLTGVMRVWSAPEVPASLQDYLTALRVANGKGGELRWYPGSPQIVRQLLRPRDRMILCELHPTEISRLQALFRGDRQAAVHYGDGYQALKAFLPPSERRGLVLCDPPYELKDERTRLVNALIAAWKRWPTGIFAIWHPIQERSATDRLYRKFKNSGIGKILQAELCIRPDDSTKQLKGSGMILLNPPYQLDLRLRSLLPWLWAALSTEGQGSWRVEWLVSD